MTVLGIDISKWNGNWDAVKSKAAGAMFTFIKASQATYSDPMFLINWKKAKDANLLRGAYHYLDYSKTGRVQADYFANLLDPDRGELPPIVDFEQRNPSITPTAARACLRDFIDQMKSRGYNPIIYTSPSYWNEYGNKDATWAQSPLWLAHYTSSSTPVAPAPWSKWTFWQFTAKGNGGVFGTESYSLDVNKYDGTLEDLMAFSGITKPTAELEQRIDGLEKRISLIEQRLTGQTSSTQTQPPTTSPSPQPVTSSFALCTASALNVRSGPGASYPVIGWLTNGQRVRIVERQNGWVKIENPAGWSGERYLRYM
jgi:lysozyme